MYSTSLLIMLSLRYIVQKGSLILSENFSYENKYNEVITYRTRHIC